MSDALEPNSPDVVSPGAPTGPPSLLSDDTETWRVDLLNRGLLLLAAFAVVINVLLFVAPMDGVVNRTPNSGLLATAAIVALALWRRGPLKPRAIALVVTLLGGELAAFINLGHAAETTLIAMTAIVVAGVVLGRPYAIATWAASVAVLAVGTLLFWSAAVGGNFDIEAVNPANPRAGVRYLLSYATLSGLMVLAIWEMVSRLFASLDETRCALEDVTALQSERASSDEARFQSEAELKSVVEAFSDLIFNVDREHRINFVNRAPGGFAVDQIIGQRAEEFVLPEYRGLLSDAVDYVFETGGTTEYDGAAAGPDGSMVWFNTRLGPVMRDGEVVAATLIATDITERRNLEAQLRQSQKLEAVGQLTGGVAHDFNNLLTVILGNLELLTDDLPSDDPSLESIEIAIEAAERGAALTQRLLAFSRQQALQPRAIDVPELLDGMDDLLRRTLGETIEIGIIADSGLARCEADPAQVEGVILNLAINARDAMPGGGKLTIDAKNEVLESEYASSQGIAAGDYVCIAVSDTGTGMSPLVLSRAFDPFFSTKEFGHGTGLGLSSVYGFVKQSRGHVKLYSEPGEGTTVRVYLPRASQAVLELGPEVQAEGEPQGRGEWILVVEDDHGVRALTLRLLGVLGYHTIEAENAVQALTALDGHLDVAMLFTDVVLPGGKSGVELSHEVRERRPEISVLFTSGYTENAIIHSGRLDPGIELIEKPFGRSSLARKVRAVLDANEKGSSERDGR